MIKCILSGKSLKQLFIISLISCFILLGSSFVNAELTIVDYGSVGLLSSVSSDWNFSYSDYNFYNATSSEKSYSRIWWQSDTFLHFNNRKYGSSSYLKGKITGFFVCPLMTGLGNTYLKNIDGCEYYFGFGSDFMNLIQNTDKWGYFYNSNSSNNWTVICGINSLSNEMICVDYSHYENEGSGKMSDSDISSVSISNPNLSSFIPSPGNSQVSIGSGLDGYNYTKIDTGDLVFYFENNPYYRYDEGVCYIGTDDFDTLYSSGSTLGLFRANNGGTIFDLFSDKFGNSFTLNNVGSFINAWNINYFTWFKGGNRDENNIPLFNAYYTLGSGFYQDFSDDLIVPFIGNPIAYYFMGYVSSLYGEYATQGQAISTYCYYKLGLDQNSGGLDISDDTSSDYLDNASDFINQHNKFYGLNSSGINIQSQSWSGSILDYFTGGENNYDFNSFFSSSFNKFKNVISLDPSDLGAGVLPTYIILFLMAIILFRFLSH